MTELYAGLIVLSAGSLGTGIVWMIRKIIQHDAWLDTIHESVVRIEAKVDRLVERL